METITPEQRDAIGVRRYLVSDIAKRAYLAAGYDMPPADGDVIDNAIRQGVLRVVDHETTQSSSGTI